MKTGYSDKDPSFKFKRKIALFSDTHVGSVFALFPDGFKTKYGHSLTLSPGQKELLGYFSHFCKCVNELDCDTIGFLGDATEGNNKKEYGKFLLTPELDIQKDAFCKLIKPLIKGRTFFMLSGSGYHQSLDTDIAKDIAESCKKVAKEVVYYGGIANIELKGTKRILHVEHGESAAMIYRTTQMDREGLFHLEAHAQDKIPKADIIAWGHVHKSIHIHLRHQHLVQVGCWKVFEPSKIFLKSYAKMQPDIGAWIILINENDKISVWDYGYPLPHIADMIQKL